MANDSKIVIFGMEEIGAQRGLFKKRDELKVGRGEVDTATLAGRISGFLDGMKDVVESIPRTVGQYQIDLVTLTAEVSAKGTVSLLGTGAELTGKGGLTFTLKRSTGAVTATTQPAGSSEAAEGKEAEAKEVEGEGSGGVDESMEAG